MKTFLLIHPRLTYRRQGAYLQNSLIVLREQLRGVFEVQIVDEVIDALPSRVADVESADLWGITCMGSSSIPEALRVAQWLRAHDSARPIFIGGQVVSRLQDDVFSRVFASVKGVQPARSLAALASEDTPSAFDVSMTRAIEDLPEHYRRAYFAKEFCIFTSQGCAFSCHFCAAEKGKKEQFRNQEQFRDEVRCLSRMVRRYRGLQAGYEVYLSALDGAQSPTEMERCLATIHAAQQEASTYFGMRMLATAKCVVKAARKDPQIFRRWREYGLVCVGLGVDGDDEAAWARENKRHNTTSEIAAAFAILKDADIRPEGLMIIGLPSDSPRQIFSATRACFCMSRNGIVPRPYLGKGHVPGSKAWDDGGQVVEAAIENPALFRDWEYAALASLATHPDRLQRLAANAGYLTASLGCKLLPMGCPTKPLVATESGSSLTRALGRVLNRYANEDR